jgi:peptidoglycan/LPS O-acetylase OafA/YrhL
VSHKRADIQGLRALAVLVVVAFHAGLPLRGGFVGVDVFFVISGYVITTMLAREWRASGRISFTGFYLRRFKRLAPALSLVVAFTVLGAALALSPLGPQEDVAKTGLGALFFVANWVIAATTGGYFDRPAGANPLLHTWSLSVEEQFYFLFPALLALGWRVRRARLVVAAVTVLSFAGALSFGGFYDPLTRAWEFGAGSLLALAAPQLRSRHLATIASLAGIELLLLSVLVLDDGTPFPSAWTLLPVAASVLLLLGGTNAASPVTRVLSTRPFVRVGDWSYSLYLWHWPLIVLAVALWPAAPHVRLAAALVSVVPALLSYHFVEQPLRTLRSRPARRLALLAAAVVALPLLVGSAMASTVTGVWAPGYKTTQLRLAHRGEIGEPGFYRSVAHYPACTPPGLRAHALRFAGVLRCAQSKPGSRIDVALIGDSHAEQLFPGLAERLPNANVLYDIVDGAPTLDDAGFARIVRDVASRPSIRTVIVSAFWFRRRITHGAQLQPTLAALRGKRVFVTDDVPWFTFDAAECKYRKSVLQASTCAAAAPDDTSSRTAIADAARATGAHVVTTWPALCTAGRCSMVAHGELLYRDWNHLNVDGSRAVAAQMLRDPAFARATADRRRPRR